MLDCYVCVFRGTSAVHVVSSVVIIVRMRMTGVGEPRSATCRSCCTGWPRRGYQLPSSPCSSFSLRDRWAPVGLIDQIVRLFLIWQVHSCWDRAKKQSRSLLRAWNCCVGKRNVALRLAPCCW
ncbi:unnamed protein product [Ectocarpus sp. 8 AP-2014]